MNQIPSSETGQSVLNPLWVGSRFMITLFTGPVSTDYTDMTIKALLDNPNTGTRALIINEGVGSDLTVTGIYHATDQKSFTVIMSQDDTAILMANTNYLLIVVTGPDVYTTYTLPVILAPGGIIP